MASVLNTVIEIVKSIHQLSDEEKGIVIYHLMTSYNSSLWTTIEDIETLTSPIGITHNWKMVVQIINSTLDTD